MSRVRGNGLGKTRVSRGFGPDRNGGKRKIGPEVWAKPDRERGKEGRGVTLGEDSVGLGQTEMGESGK